MVRPGPENLITDVEGIRVGQRHDAVVGSGVTVILFDKPAIAAATVLGGGPGTRDLEAIGLEGLVGVCDAIVLSGGSAFGLDAATGVQSYLREQGRGFSVGVARVPIVPQAILFDLNNGGDKAWGRHPPYRDLAYVAAQSAGRALDLGSCGAGFGATVADGSGSALRGGLGSASVTLDGLADGLVTMGAIAAVNAAGTVTIPGIRQFWAAPYEQAGEFGGLGLPDAWPDEALVPALKWGGLAGANTTLCAVATNAELTRAECKRLSIMAAAGMARAIAPVFTPFDGDIVFAISTTCTRLKAPQTALPLLGTLAANCLARSIARGVYLAHGALPDGTPSYQSRA